MGEARFAGQEGSFTLLNSTTGEQLLPDMHIESISASFLKEMVIKRYIGQIGPEVRSFDDGYELGVKFDPHNAITLVAFVTLCQAKAQGKINDEFAAQMKLVSPTGGTCRIVYRDVHWDSSPISLGGQHELLNKEIKGRGRTFKITRE